LARSTNIGTPSKEKKTFMDQEVKDRPRVLAGFQANKVVIFLLEPRGERLTIGGGSPKKKNPGKKRVGGRYVKGKSGEQCKREQRPRRVNPYRKDRKNWAWGTNLRVTVRQWKDNTERNVRFTKSRSLHHNR